MTDRTNVHDYFLNNYICTPFVELFHNIVAISTLLRAL